MATRNFSDAEFACKCGKTGNGYCGGNNWVKQELLEGLQALRNIINAERRREGQKEVGIVIVSGCRCEAHNKAVGGAKQSQHLYGTAADIYIPEYTPAQILEYIDRHRLFTGVGTYKGKNTVHVDVRDGLAGPQARW